MEDVVNENVSIAFTLNLATSVFLNKLRYNLTVHYFPSSTLCTQLLTIL